MDGRDGSQVRQGGAIADDGEIGVPDQSARRVIDRRRFGKGRSDRIPLLVARCDQHDAAGRHDGGEALGDHPVGNVGRVVEEAGVVGSGGRREFGHVGAAPDGGAGLVEADVAVASDAEDLEVDTAQVAEQRVETVSGGVEVAGVDVGCVEMGIVDARWFGEEESDGGPVPLRTAVGEPDVLVEQRQVRALVERPALDQRAVRGQRRRPSGHPEHRRSVTGHDVGDDRTDHFDVVSDDDLEPHATSVARHHPRDRLVSKVSLLLASTSVVRALGAQPAHLRDINERVVYGTVRSRRPITRAEVARHTQLSKPTVSLALARLQEVGLVAEADDQRPRAGQHGRRAGVFYEPVSRAALAVGAELDADAVRAVLTDLDGNELDRTTVDFQADDADDVFAAVARAVASLAPRRHRRSVRAVVIGTPGIIDPTTGVLSHSGFLPALDGSQPATALTDRLGVPVTVVNDVDLAAVGEQTRGHGRGCDDFAVISIGTGMGAALVLNGQLYRGARGGAGELDDVPFRRVVRSTPPVSPALDGVSGLAKALARTHRSSELTPPYTAANVFAAHGRGDRLAVAVVERLGEWTSWFAASLAAIVDPELIVLTGSIGAHDSLADLVRNHLDEMLPSPPTIAVSSLGAESVLAGAVATASEQALQATLAERLGSTA